MMSDLISRSALKKAIKAALLYGIFAADSSHEAEQINEGFRLIKEVLDEQPAVDAAPVVHGRWAWHEERWEHECTHCHCGFDYDKTYLLFDNGYEYASYCPNCGAKMDGGAEA